MNISIRTEKYLKLVNTLDNMYTYNSNVHTIK